MSSPSSFEPRAAADPDAASRPRLDLDWEVGAFRLLRRVWARISGKHERSPSPPNPNEARLEDHTAALRVVAQIIAEAPLRIRPARNAGGVRGLDLLLPARIALAKDEASNRDILIVRTAISAAIQRLGSGRPTPSDPSLRELESLHRAREAIDWLSRQFPEFAAAHEEAVRSSLLARPALEILTGRERLLEGIRRDALGGGRPWLDHELSDALRRLPPTRRGDPTSPAIEIWGELVDAPGTARGADEEPSRDADDDERLPSHDASEFEAFPVDEIVRIELDEKEQEDAVLIHTFEKVETADEYAGGARDTDGADELADQMEALEEVDLRDVMRGGAQAHSMLRSEIQLETDVPLVGRAEPGERGVLYPEWDHRRQNYRDEWCTVYPTAFPAKKPEWAREACARHAGLIRDLTRRLSVHRSRLEARDRQPDGEDIDLRAFVDERCARRAGRGGNTRLYVRRAKRRRDFATTVLIDVSLSSDSWVSERRVLDVAREAVLVLGDVTTSFGDRLQVLAFASHTRNHCRVWEISAWNDDWETGRARLGALTPQGYTRIGPALRHATQGLAAQPADERLLLLVSDGKPTDYDRYEGRYGIADVRQALREADRMGISVHALAVDRVAGEMLPAMFGPGGWHILPNPNHLPEVMTTLYGRLTGR